jgi:8-oxo-dGTP pyrophosphatase MutT (NUDIX family)
LGGVLVLLYGKNDELNLVLTRRRDDLQSHAGQISFPGGRHEDPETLLMTALRETHEEIGVPPTAVMPLGTLASLYIPPSDFEVHPFVGWYSHGERPIFTPDTGEVAEILEVPLRHLIDPATRQEEPWELRGQQVKVPYYDVQGYKVWGATAMMLSELIERLQTHNKQLSLTADNC